MLRLVKGAYWDSEIKRAQVEGLEGFSVFTRKIHTDVSYLACAKRLLAAPDAIFPQFATHNAMTLATVHAMAGENFYAGQYEFQCLHGMGEPLYNQIVGAGGESRPCRIYAPVGSHETLLAYLVRRLLENGANSSFVNRIADANVLDRGADRGPGRGGAGARPARRAASADRAARRRCSRRRAPIRPASISATRRASPRWPMRSPTARAPTGAQGAKARRRARSSTPPMRTTSSAMSSRPGAARSIAPSPPPRAALRRGRRGRRLSARASSSPPRRAWKLRRCASPV